MLVHVLLHTKAWFPDDRKAWFPYDRNSRRPTATHRRRVPDQSATYGNDLGYDHVEARLQTHLNSFDASPYCPRLIGDIGDVVQKMFPLNATVPDVSPSLPRRRVADCYDHMETRLNSRRPTATHRRRVPDQSATYGPQTI